DSRICHLPTATFEIRPFYFDLCRLRSGRPHPVFHDQLPHIRRTDKIARNRSEPAGDVRARHSTAAVSLTGWSASCRSPLLHAPRTVFGLLIWRRSLPVHIAVQ